MNNIDCFNTCAVMILNKLYNSFPRPTRLVLRKEEITLLEEDHLEKGCINEDEPSGTLYKNTLKYLLEEGIIRGREGARHYNDVVLTTKG